MEREEAVEIMRQLSVRLEPLISIEDMVAPFAEFMVHIEPHVKEEDFAFLSSVGAMIYLNGSDKYHSCVEADSLLSKLRTPSKVK